MDKIYVLQSLRENNINSYLRVKLAQNYLVDNTSVF